jgi:hypothetical protein
MTIIAIVLGLAIIGFAFFLYWVMMMILGGIFLLFLFWVYVCSYIFMEPYNVLCAVIATGLVIWALVAYSNKIKNPPLAGYKSSKP